MTTRLHVNVDEVSAWPSVDVPQVSSVANSPRARQVVRMTLTELPGDVAELELGQKARAGRKRLRGAGSPREVARPRGEDVPIPPIRVDKDLLLQVVRVKVQTLIRSARLRERGLEPQPGRAHDPRCTAERLERLVPVIEQRWLQDLLNGDEPRYGFDDVVRAFQGIIHADADDRDAGQQTP